MYMFITIFLKYHSPVHEVEYDRTWDFLPMFLTNHRVWNWYAVRLLTALYIKKVDA
jgi:hypothetical protein